MKAKTLLLSALMVLAFIGSAAAKDVRDTDSWQFGIGLYGWYGDIGGDMASVGETKIEADDLIENLQLGGMGVLEAHKGDWSFLADVIYLDVANDANPATGLHAELELTNWIVTPMIAYRFVNTDRFECSALAGARYLYMKAELALDTRAPLPVASQSASQSDDNWDGIIGLHGHVNLTESWHLPFHLDIGTGDSDLTWQALAGIGYRFSRVDIVAGYRYLSWDFDQRPVFEGLDVKGPYLGVKFWF